MKEGTIETIISSKLLNNFRNFITGVKSKTSVKF